MSDTVAQLHLRESCGLPFDSIFSTADRVVLSDGYPEPISIPVRAAISSIAESLETFAIIEAPPCNEVFRIHTMFSINSPISPVLSQR